MRSGMIRQSQAEDNRSPSNVLASLLTTVGAVILLLSASVPRAEGGDTDFRVMITTDLVDGVEVLCQTEDRTYQMRKRRIMPGDTDYAFPFCEAHPAYLSSRFLCTVVDGLGHEMTFTAWDARLGEKRWRFPERNDQRDVRWAVNNAGAWVFLKCRKHVESIMRWMLCALWPHLQIASASEPAAIWYATSDEDGPEKCKWLSTSKVYWKHSKFFKVAILG